MSGAGLVCFDLDGCLVESDRAIGDGLTHALKAVGLEPPAPEDVRPLIGQPLVTSLRALLEDGGVDTASGTGGARLDAVAASRPRYATEGCRLTTVAPGMHAALAEVEAKAVTLRRAVREHGAVGRR